jgi:flagellar biosynthesis protein FlhB
MDYDNVMNYFRELQKQVTHDAILMLVVIVAILLIILIIDLLWSCREIRRKYR